MAYWYQGTDNVVAGTAVTMGNNDFLYVRDGVAVGSSSNATGVTATTGTHSTIYGAVLSVGGIGFASSGGSNELTLGTNASVTGGTSAIELAGNNNTITSDGMIAGDKGIDFLGNFNAVFNTGRIDAHDDPAITLRGGGNHISNSGAIASSSDTAILILSLATDFQNTIDNSGTIAANEDVGLNAIVTGDALTRINNSGHITGFITFGASNDTYDGTLGRVTGYVNGGEGDDTLLGGAGRDYLSGGFGSDTLDGNEGRDLFAYNSVFESGAVIHDTILGFNARRDTFDLNTQVTAIDPTVAGGTLNDGNDFATDVAAAVGEAELLAHHAVLFTPNAGDLAGHIILVVDVNGNSGFQKNKDYVFELNDPENLGALDIGDFI